MNSQEQMLDVYQWIKYLQKTQIFHFHFGLQSQISLDLVLKRLAQWRIGNDLDS